MVEFKDDDPGFMHWKETHSDGFVLNTTRSPRTDYLMLHRATCPHLTWRNANVHWTKDYIKICATEMEDLVRWSEQHITGQPQPTPCSTCKP